MDVTVGVAQAIRRMCDEQGKQIPAFLRHFVRLHDPDK